MIERARRAFPLLRALLTVGMGFAAMLSVGSLHPVLSSALIAVFFALVAEYPLRRWIMDLPAWNRQQQYELLLENDQADVLLRVLERQFPPEQVQDSEIASWYFRAHWALHQPAEAERWCRWQVQYQRQVIDTDTESDHLSYYRWLTNLAEMQRMQGHFAAALETLRDVPPNEFFPSLVLYMAWIAYLGEDHAAARNALSRWRAGWEPNTARIACQLAYLQHVLEGAPRPDADQLAVGLAELDEDATIYAALPYGQRLRVVVDEMRERLT